MNAKIKHEFNSEIVREYDIRGIYGENLIDQDAFFLGIAVGNYLDILKLNKIVSIGRDGRNSSGTLRKQLVSGLKKSGCDVIDLGIVPTSAVHFFCHTNMHITAGIMITASHNPKRWNGFKISVQKQSIYGQELFKLCQLTHHVRNNYLGKYRPLDISNNYIDYITNPEKHLSCPKTCNNKIKILWDASNGSAATIINKITPRLPGQHIVINSDINGNFPAHPADPCHHATIEYVKENITFYKCDFAFIFDGDGDRLIMLDKYLNIFYGDSLLCIFAMDLSRRICKPTVIADVKISQTYFNKIIKEGLSVIISKTGYPYIKDKMQREHSLLAGEVSGHIFFKENYFGFDDAIFAACKLTYLMQDLNILNSINNIPEEYTAIEVKVSCSSQNKKFFIAELKNILKQHKIEFLAIDGIRCQNSLGWWIIRASNTENIIFIRFGSTTYYYFNFIFIYLSHILQKIGIDFQDKTKLLNQNDKYNISG